MPNNFKENKQIVCPVCKGNYVHIGKPKQDFLSEKVDGVTVYIPMVGECGHKWRYYLGFHKGNTYQWEEYMEDTGSSILRIDKWLKKI